ncbi:MAG: ATP-binding protein [Oligoflexus sp.]
MQENWHKVIADWQSKPESQTLENILRLEVIEKKSRSIQRRIIEAKLGRLHRMHDFDWNHPKEIDRNRIERLLNLGFLAANQNVIFIGPQGLGKTMLSKNIAWNAVNKGHRALFSTASKIVSDLLHSGHKFETAMKKYTSPDVLVIDELGYLSFEQKAADALFEVISRRYESKSIVLSTNLGFADWPTIFPGAACVTALVDRLTHNADIVRITGSSFRTKQTKSKKV